MNKDYGIIMGYFNRKNFDRERLEKSCDFENSGRWSGKL